MNNAATPEAERYWDFVRMAMMSTANTCITPLQDFLGLDVETRINKPSTLGGNWEWRMDADMLSKEAIEKIYQITRISCRLSDFGKEQEWKKAQAAAEKKAAEKKAAEEKAAEEKAAKEKAKAEKAQTKPKAKEKETKKASSEKKPLKAKN